jgi:hypothetical protein
MSRIPMHLVETNLAPGSAAKQGAAAASHGADSCVTMSQAFAAWLGAYRRRLEQECDGSTSRLLHCSAAESGQESRQ